MMKNNYAAYTAQLRKAADVAHAISILHWDNEIFMPEKGANFRARQISTLSTMCHELLTSPMLGELLDKLQSDTTLNEWEQRNVSESLKSYYKKQRLNSDFVAALSQATSEAYQTWLKAREANDYQIFAPKLAKIVDLQRQKADLLGYKNHPYNALADEFEPDITVTQLDQIFAGARSQLVDFVREIAQCPPPNDDFLYKHYNKDTQWKYGLDLLKQMGYDFLAGRQDISPHPFTTTFSPTDVRVTTRINENDFKEMTWSCIHEGGHALYEQGLNADYYGLPTGEAASLGIHESQSRLWENNVGRSAAFWRGNYANLQAIFPENLGQVTAQNFYKAINKVNPSLIRTNADELTYHFHILIRYELEKELIAGNLLVADLSTAWNDKYKAYLGLDVPNDKMGVLQDIHWAYGNFGYFPTYSLGSFYAAQFYEQAGKDIPQLEAYIEAGNMQPLLAWLQKNIYCYGRFYNSEDLCQKVTGQPLNFDCFMRYVKNKYNDLYDL